MRQLISISVCVGVLTLVTSAVQAIDHSNLDENRPLRIEDAYPISVGEFALEAGVGYTMERHGTDRAFFPMEVLYGAYPGLQLSLGSTLLTDPREIDGPHKSGDLRLSSLYNFNQETLSQPAFGLRGSLNVPTGVRSAGVDFELKGLVTKSFNRWSLHFNPAYEFLSGGGRDERDGRYSFTLGTSYPIGAPKYTRTTLVADVFTEQSSRKGEANVWGAEAGFRHQMTQRLVLDFGVGSEFAGPAKRSTFFVTTGISFSF